MEASLVQRIIEGALKIIQDPNRWTKGVYARDDKGYQCYPHSDEAMSFCAAGAIERVAYEIDADSDPANHAIRDVCLNYHEVNDGPDGRRRVIAIFKKALKNLRT
jgi:hypothetical protein